MHTVEAEYPAANHVLVHVSDPHFVSEGLLYGDLDLQAVLPEVSYAVEAGRMGPEGIIFCGDLRDKGKDGAYRQLRTLFEHPCSDSYRSQLWNRWPSAGAPGNPRARCRSAQTLPLRRQHL